MRTVRVELVRVCRAFVVSTILASLLAASACDASNKAAELRQGTSSYQFAITSPGTPPVVGDDVTYVIYARDRNTGQPIETGEGRIFARAGSVLAGSFVKAPQIGQYRGTLRFPSAGGWGVGIQFRDQPGKVLELTQWVQEVRSTAPSEKTSSIAPPWLWRAAGKK